MLFSMPHSIPPSYVLPNSSVWNYWVGLKVCSGFSVLSYGKSETNFRAIPDHSLFFCHKSFITSLRPGCSWPQYRANSWRQAFCVPLTRPCILHMLDGLQRAVSKEDQRPSYSRTSRQFLSVPQQRLRHSSLPFFRSCLLPKFLTASSLSSSLSILGAISNIIIDYNPLIHPEIQQELRRKQ